MCCSTAPLFIHDCRFVSTPVILNNPTDQQVQNLLQNVDLYICPLENPDGTYHSSNTRIGTSTSQRANWNNVDMYKEIVVPRSFGITFQ